MDSFRHQFFIIFFLSIFGSGCSFLVPDPADGIQKDENYFYSLDSSSWKKTDTDTSDHAYQNLSTGSHIIMNSLCRKYETTSLKDLSSNVLTGIQNLKIHDEKYGMRFSRKSYEIKGKGEIDGVRVSFLIITVKRNRCTYDFALIGVGDMLDIKEIQDFTKVLDSIRFKT